MKKQYMDFVPTKSAKPVKTQITPKKQVKPASKAVSRAATTQSVSKKTVSKVAFKGEEKRKLGKVENLNTRFVKSDVPKRPLNRAPHFTTGKTGLAATKAQKVGLKSATPAKSVEKPVKNSKKTVGVYRAPKSPFINSDTVPKRPLSKNIYPKKVAPMLKEEQKGPVTIISKPEKQAHVGMIVTIILTIILGAAAGTVAFLLLPK